MSKLAVDLTPRVTRTFDHTPTMIDSVLQGFPNVFVWMRHASLLARLRIIAERSEFMTGEELIAKISERFGATGLFENIDPQLPGLHCGTTEE